SEKSIIDIKEKLDDIIQNLDKSITTSKDFECKLIKLVNDIYVIKACIDNELLPENYIYPNKSKYIKNRLKPIFDFLKNHAQKYNYNFPNNIVSRIRDVIFEYNYLGIDFDLIGKLYQLYLKDEDKKEFGQFYTPESIIDEILDDIGVDDSNTEIINSTFLDPSCGTGSFISRTTNRIIKILNNRNTCPNIIIESVCNNIYGLDIKDFSIYIAKSNMMIQLIPVIKKAKKYQMKFNLYVTDTLKNLTDSIEFVEDQNINSIKQKTGKHKNGFDYIIGNPPYFKIKELSISQKEYFEEVLKGQQNMYGLFLYFSINHLKDNGKLGMIIPESIKSGLYFHELRRFIFSKCTITHIVSFNCRKTNFYDALQGVLIICLTKALSNKESKIELKNVTNKDFLQLKKFNNRIKMDYDDVVRQIRNYKILLVCKTNEDYMLFNQAYVNCVYLDDPQIGFSVHTGKLVWNQVKEYLLDKPENDECKNIIWSNNIEQYKLTLTGNKKGEKGFAIKRDKLLNRVNKGECIFIRRTSTKEQNKRISSYYYANQEEYFIENQVNYIVKQNNSSNVSYYYILALMNSTLMNFLITQIVGNTQISTTELYLLPIKVNQNAEIITNLLSTARDVDSINEDLIDRIDDLVYSTYNINL
ncbi:MAG TPA: N-6 DNA methylase, partial [Patescibacteria group bacterium]|nr:N-6 DNA methylase [Patescibacteria group bacterium]